MKLFNKFNCTIVADKETNFEVQKFACRHMKKNTVIHVNVSDNDLNTIEFSTGEKRLSIIEQLTNEFGDFHIRVGKEIIYVTKVKKGSE